MEALELSVATVEDAAAQAAAEWGVSPSDVKVTVLEETKGLFGKPGKLRVKVEPPKAKKGRAAKPAKEEAAPAPVVEEAPVEEPKAEKPAKPKRGAKAAKVEEAAPAEEGAAEAPAAEEARPEVVATQEDADRMVEMLNGLMKSGDLDVEVKVSSVQGRYVNIELDGEDVGYLVGRRGEVLNALQYVCNVIASRQLRNGVRITIEGNNFRKRREEALTRLAENIAEQVRERGEEAVLDALPAFERRIVHQALMNFDGVMTYSEGEEPNRRVVIAPQD